MKKILLLFLTTFPLILLAQSSTNPAGNVNQSNNGKANITDYSLFPGNTFQDTVKSERIRFSEYTYSLLDEHIQTNYLNIGVHNIVDSDVSNDLSAFSIKRDNGFVSLDRDDAYQNLSAKNSQLFFGNSTYDKVESVRAIFSEFTNNLQRGNTQIRFIENKNSQPDAFIHYDEDTNILKIDAHNTEIYQRMKMPFLLK